MTESAVETGRADDGEVEPLLRRFDFYHLHDGKTRELAKMFSELAYRMTNEIPQGKGRSISLRLLAGARDAAVRYSRATVNHTP
jgi:hypothetical protein